MTSWTRTLISHLEDALHRPERREETLISALRILRDPAPDPELEHMIKERDLVARKLADYEARVELARDELIAFERIVLASLEKHIDRVSADMVRSRILETIRILETERDAV